MKQAKRVLVGTGAALAVYFALLAAASALIVRGSVAETSLAVCVLVSAFVAAFLGSRIAGSQDRLGDAALCAVSFLTAVVLLGFLINDGLDFSRAAQLAPAILCGAALASVMRFGKGKRTRGKRRSGK